MSDPMNQDMILGEMRGQLRELVHQVNNLSAKFDALTREVIALGPIAVQIAELRAEVDVLKVAKNQQAGAHNVISTILKSPTLGWMVGAISVIWLYLTGKLQP